MLGGHAAAGPARRRLASTASSSAGRSRAPARWPGDPAGEYFVARVGDRDVAGVGSAGPGGGPAWNTYIRVDSATMPRPSGRRRPAARCVAGPFDAPPAGRLAVLADPAGASFCVWEAADREGAQVDQRTRRMVDEHAQSPAIPRARRTFYGEAVRLGDGGLARWTAHEFWLWRLPGYLGGEPEQPVPRDVVAVMARGRRDGAPVRALVGRLLGRRRR